MLRSATRRVVIVYLYVGYVAFIIISYPTAQLVLGMHEQTLIGSSAGLGISYLFPCTILL